MLLIKVLYISFLLLFYVNATENVIYRSTRQIQQYDGVRQSNDGQTHRKLSSQLKQMTSFRPQIQTIAPDNLQVREAILPSPNLTTKYFEEDLPIFSENNQDSLSRATPLRNEQEVIIGDTTTARLTNLDNIEGTVRDLDFQRETAIRNSLTTANLPSQSTERSNTIFTNKVFPESETTQTFALAGPASKDSQQRLPRNPLQILPTLLQKEEYEHFPALNNVLTRNPAEIGTILVNSNEMQDFTEALPDDGNLKQYQLRTPIQKTENLFVDLPLQTTTPSAYSVYYRNNQAFQVGSERFTSTLRPSYNVPMNHKPLSEVQPNKPTSFIAQPSNNPKFQLVRQLNTEPAVDQTSPQPYDQECLREYAYYAIENHCDSFIECKEKRALRNTCPEGLHFNPKVEWPNYPCSYPSEVKCELNAKIEPPIPTEQCPHQFGFFQSPDGDCNKYIMCQHGRAINMTCAPGLVFNMETAICDWPDNVPACEPNIFSGFICPQLPAAENSYGETVTMHRYSNSCRKFVACQKGIPRLLSCDPGLAFDEQTEKCVIADNVVNCENDNDLSKINNSQQKKLT